MPAAIVPLPTEAGKRIWVHLQIPVALAAFSVMIGTPGGQKGGFYFVDHLLCEIGGRHFLRP